MTASMEQILFFTAILLLSAVAASKASGRIGVPSLLLFLAVGMLAGSDGPGGIDFDNAWQAQFVGVLALALILFAGGVDTEWESVRPVLWRGLALSTIGVLLTAVLLGAGARLLLKTSWQESLLLGAIVSSTDAAAVFSILRSRSVRLKGRLQPLLEFESGSNDPMAVFLTTGLIGLIRNPAASPVELLPQFFWQMAAGGALGFAGGRAAVWTLNRLKLASDGLYPVFTTAVVLLVYGGASLANANGFLAVYVAGITIGHEDFIHKRSLMRFHDGVSWLMQIAMFLVLGLLVYPSRLLPIAGSGLALSLILIFVARPASVFLSLALSRMQVRQKALVAWVGLRGAVPIVLATFPMLAGLPRADLYFHLVFFIVLTSVLVQGSTIGWVAGRLHLQAPLSVKRQYPLEFVPARRSRSGMLEIEVPAGAPADGRQIVDLKLPRSALIVLVSRDEDFLAPRGATVLKGGDSVLVLADKEDFPAIRAAVAGGDGAVEV
jgi:cell volume regulation protein A